MTCAMCGHPIADHRHDPCSGGYCLRVLTEEESGGEVGRSCGCPGYEKPAEVTPA